MGGIRHMSGPCTTGTQGGTIIFPTIYKEYHQRQLRHFSNVQYCVNLKSSIVFNQDYYMPAWVLTKWREEVFIIILLLLLWPYYMAGI
jgi:hypothetical protein